MRYDIETTTQFNRRYKKLVKRNKKLDKSIRGVIKSLSQDPFLPHLGSHEVESRNFGLVYSTRVTGDLRILWEFDDRGNMLILLLTIGGHSGKRSVY